MVGDGGNDQRKINGSGEKNEEEGGGPYDSLAEYIRLSKGEPFRLDLGQGCILCISIINCALNIYDAELHFQIVQPAVSVATFHSVLQQELSALYFKDQLEGYVFCVSVKLC